MKKWKKYYNLIWFAFLKVEVERSIQDNEDALGPLGLKLHF